MATKKIICTVITDPNYDQRMQRICTALSQAGYHVTLIGQRFAHSQQLTERPYQQKRISCFFEKSVFFYAEYNIRLFFILFFSSFDLVCSIDLDSILPGFIVSKFKNKIFVHDAHELFSEMPELDEKPIVKKVWSSIEKFVFRRMKYAYTESEGYQEIYNANYPNLHFEVVRNVPFYYKTNRENDDGYILYQGALNVGRGLEFAIEAMQDIDADLWLCGEGDLSAQLREQVQELSLEHKVKFLGWVKPEDLREITMNARVGINLLSMDNRHYQLSFPNKLFDYIMAELPQVSMNFPYYQQVTKEESIGVLINELSTTAVRDAILALLNNESLYKECVQSCKKLKEIHNWEQEKQKLIDFYARITW